MTTIDRSAESGPPRLPLAIKERVNVAAMTTRAAVVNSTGSEDASRRDRRRSESKWKLMS